MENKKFQVLIVGAGIAGLRCAQVLSNRGISTLILEKENKVGGRIKTRSVKGFLLDEGFQVLLDSYEEVHQAISFSDLKANAYSSGALVADGKGNVKAAFNPFHHPEKVFSSLFQFPGSFSDVGKLAWMALQNQKSDPDFWKGEIRETAAGFLAEKQFSHRFFNGFLRPFFGGVFLDPDLNLPKSYFLWLLGKFLIGRAFLPEKGMAALPETMAKSAGDIRFQARVASLKSGQIVLESGEILEADWVVDARPFQEKDPKMKGRSTVTVYLEGPFQKNLPQCLVLNGNKNSSILHFSFPSAVQPTYAPEGKCLCSITFLEKPGTRNFLPDLQNELTLLYPKINWLAFQCLEVISVPHALPTFSTASKMTFEVEERLIRIGDHCTYPSINGALRSGREAGEWLLGK
jgi:phytoene dehydrogenase-like protein